MRQAEGSTSPTREELAWGWHRSSWKAPTSQAVFPSLFLASGFHPHGPRMALSLQASAPAEAAEAPAPLSLGLGPLTPEGGLLGRLQVYLVDHTMSLCRTGGQDRKVSLAGLHYGGRRGSRAHDTEEAARSAHGLYGVRLANSPGDAVSYPTSVHRFLCTLDLAVDGN